jgi:hypothetical protein
MPVWALLVSLTVAFIYVLPGGFIFAMTSQQVGPSSPHLTMHY